MLEATHKNWGFTMVNAVISRCKNRCQWLSNNFKQCELISPTFKLLFRRICSKIIIFCCSSVFEFNHSKKQLKHSVCHTNRINKTKSTFLLILLAAQQGKKQLAYKKLFTKGSRKLCKVRILCHMRIHALLYQKKETDKNNWHALLWVNGQRVQANEIKCWGRSVRR